MMNQKIIEIEKIDLLNKALDMKNAGYRLAQACAVKKDGVYLLYSFVKGDDLTTLRFKTEEGDLVESVSWLYSYAFIYENEIKELFGVNIVNMNLDFNGNFYETKIKRAFNPVDESSAERGDTDG